MQRRIVKHRLCQAGQSHCDSFYDAKNGFPSVDRAVCVEVIDNTCRLEDRRLLKQHNNQAVLRIQAADREVCICSGSGSLQGDAPAGSQFLEQYHPALDLLLEKLAEFVKGMICSQLTPSVNSSWRLLLPHMLTTRHVRVCAHLQANWLKSSIMRTLCSVKLYNHWGLHRTWKSRCTCRAFSDEVLINTLAQSFISDCFPATRVVLQDIWYNYIMPWETNLQRSNKEFTKLMWDGFQWESSGFDKGFFVSRWSSCSKVLCIQRCYQDLKLFALPGRNWLSLIGICLNAVGSSCMAQRARKNPPIKVWSTKRDQTLRYGVFYRLFRRMLN